MGLRGQQNFFFYTANNVHQTQVPIFNCPGDPTLRPGLDLTTNYAQSSYAANFMVFGNVDGDFACADAQGKPRLAVSFPDGASNTILFAEKYAAPSPPTPLPGGEGGMVNACHSSSAKCGANGLNNRTNVLSTLRERTVCLVRWLVSSIIAEIAVLNDIVSRSSVTRWVV